MDSRARTKKATNRSPFLIIRVVSRGSAVKAAQDRENQGYYSQERYLLRYQPCFPSHEIKAVMMFLDS